MLTLPCTVVTTSIALARGSVTIPGLASTSDSVAATSSSVHYGSPIDWNGLFQRLLESPDQTQDSRLKKYEDISTLNNNFVSMAKQLGKIIITEAFLPDEVKTIKPYSVGGVAGGCKYLYNGILFKLQNDWKGIYQSDHHAMKSGSLELKGLMRYYGFKHIHVPLMAIIDFRGYRLLAESKLPIGPETLHYGSADAGVTVNDGSSCPELRDLMKTVGTSLNLAGHWCGSPAQPSFLYSPIDVEGHRGHDGRYYVIDLARVFPPTAEPGGDVRHTFLYQCLRPEFVRRYHMPLSSDAFSKFSKSHADAEMHNERVKGATSHLLDTVVPEFAAWLEENPTSIRDDQLADVTELAHREGINVRYLGLVRSRLTSPRLRSAVLMELIARVIKNNLNEELRKAAKQSKNRGDENLQPIALSFFNLILGSKPGSEAWWSRTIKDHLTATYKAECLSPEEKQRSFSLRPSVDLHTLFRRLQALTGIQFTKIVMQQLKSSKYFELVSPDIRKMGVRVKHMNITSQAQGAALAIQAMASMNSHIELVHTVRDLPGFDPRNEEYKSSSYDRLLDLSMMKYEQAIRATPDNKSMLTHYASTLLRVALLKTSLGEPAASYFSTAFQKLRICGNTTAMLQLGELLQYIRGYWSEADLLLQIACDCFHAVADADPTLSLAWMCWADTLVARARVTRDIELYTLAGEKYLRAIKLTPLAGAEWLSNCLHCLSPSELATAVELIGRRKQRLCDSLYPILESTPTGDPIQANEQEIAEYRQLVESVSINIREQEAAALLAAASSEFNPKFEEDSVVASELTNSSVVIPKSPSPSISGILTPQQLGISASMTASSGSSSAGAEAMTAGADIGAGLVAPSVTGSGSLLLSPRTISGSNGSITSSGITSTSAPPRYQPASLSALDASLAFKRELIKASLLEPLMKSFPGLKSLRLAGCSPLPFRINSSCPSLTELNVSGCIDATDTLIAGIVTIPTLAKLNISHCPKLSHLALKDVMTKCGALTHFYANYFGACKEPRLEPQVGFLSGSLQTLHLAGMRTAAESWCRLIACSNLSSLRKLVLDECLDVSDVVLTAVGQHCPLTHVSLKGCTNVTNQGMEALATPHLKHNKHASGLSSPETTHKPHNTSKAIRYLDITDCYSLTSHALEVFAAHLTHLESLIANNVNLFGSQSTWLGAPTTSVSNSNDSLTTSSNSISTSGSIPISIQVNSSQDGLAIPVRSKDELRASAERSRLTASFSRLIENNPNLCRLELAHTGVTDAHLATIAGSARALAQLKLVSEFVTDAGLHSLAKAGLPIQLLDLERAAVTDKGVREIAMAFSHTLSALSLSSCNNAALTDEALFQVSIHCPLIAQLDISHSTVASDRSVSAIAERCPKLQRLSVVGCRFLTDYSIEALARHAHKLQSLNLSRCPCIISLGPLGDGCPELRELRARGCEFVSDDAPNFNRLANLRNLRFLDLQGCHYITDITLGMLETDACPDLEVLQLGRNKIRDVHLQSLRMARRNLHVQNFTDQPLGTGSTVTRMSTSMHSSGSVLLESSELAIPTMHPHSPAHHGNSSLGSTSSSSTGMRANLHNHLRSGTPIVPGNVTSSVATKTLMNDLKAIQRNPVPYVSAEPVDEANLYVWHGNLLGPENTPYAGAIFHIELVFPADYPTNPPSATLFTPLPHPHVHKDHICLDILSDYKGYFSAIQELEGKDMHEMSGWHPSYTVQSILLSMQSFLMDMKENAHGTELRELMVKIPDSIRIAANFECPKCPHKPGKPFPPILSEVPPEALSEKDIIAEELRCVHTRAPFTEDVLGICVGVQQWRNGGTILNMYYDLHLISHKAFQSGVRMGANAGNNSAAFMPLWIDESHGARSMPIAEASIAQLYTGNEGAIFKPVMALDVLTQLMKAMVVDLVKTGASINSLQYYFASHRLLIAFVTKYPELLETANSVVSKFAESPHYRSKRECPDLGCLLMLLSVTTTVSWRDIAQAYMQESFVRNAPRAMEKAPELATPHPDPTVDAMRNEKTFLVTRVSLYIAMLQVYFLEHIGRPKDVKLATVAASYDSLYGRLPVKVREDFLEMIKSILNTKTFADTFKFLGLPPRPNDELTSWLRDCVQLSIRAGYYKRSDREKERDRAYAAGEHYSGGSGGGSSGGGGGGSSRNLWKSGGGGGMARSGSAKFNARGGKDSSPNQPHGTPSGKRGRSRGSSASSSSEAYPSAFDDCDVAEFDSGGALSTPSRLAVSSSLPGTRATSPADHRDGHASTSADDVQTGLINAWTSLPNPLFPNRPPVSSTPPLTPHSKDIMHPSSASPRNNATHTPPQHSQNATHLPTPTPVVMASEDDNDDQWIPAGRPRRKSKGHAGNVPIHSPTAGRGLGRGNRASPKSNPHSHR